MLRYSNDYSLVVSVAV